MSRQGRGRKLRISEFSIRYPVTICMLLLSFLVLGGVSIGKIPLVLFPNLDAPFVLVVVPYANSTPEQIQESITKPLEEALSTIPRMTRIFSTSMADQAVVEMTFPWGEDTGWLRSEIREKVEQARPGLPQDVDQIFVQNFSTTDIPILEGRISSGRDLRGSYDFLDLKIKKPLERVPGVAEVEIGGVLPREINIDLSLDAIKSRHVDVDRLFRRLDGTNLNVSLGRVVEGGFRFGVLARSTIVSLAELRAFPVDERGLRLGDIAEIRFRDPEPAYGRHLNGEFAIALSLRKASDANTVETVERVMARVDELNRDPSLDGVEVLIWHNAGEEITKSLSGLLDAGSFGALLAVVVLLFFLRRLAATLIIGFAIPFSIVSAVGFLYLAGSSLNVLSMMGLMLSTGMLVDNAVVVLESIYQQLEKGRGRREAARIGTRQVIKAVVASTLTSAIIFVPLVFGKKTNLSVFLGEAGMAIILALFCSLFVSLTLIPLAVARFLETGGGRTEPGRAGRATVMECYLATMSWSLRHRYLVGLLIVPLIVALSLGVLFKLPDNSPGAEDLEELTIQYDFHDNYHYAKIEQDFVNPVEAFLLAHRERLKIDNLYSFYANNEASTRIYFDPERVSLGEVEEIRKEIADALPEIPGADIYMSRQEGAENRNWISVNLYGEDVSRLQEFAQAAKKAFKEGEEFDEFFTPLEGGREEVRLRLNRARARRYGVSPQSVSGILAIVLRGRRIRGFRGPEGEIDIWVRLRPGDREDLSDLKSMVVGGGEKGREVLLSQVADLSIVKTPGSIRRENRQTYAPISVNYTGSNRDQGMERVTEIMDSLNLPEGYGWGYGFFTLQRDQENTDFLFNFLLALFMVYFVMASLFESIAHPFAIMLSLLFAFVGVAWFLFLTATPFNIMAMIGMMILVGIVVNNGIVLLDHINNLRRAGRKRVEAIQEGCRERFRPILMTALTTVVGLIPLAVGTTGLLGLRYFPMARTVMGGLIASTVLTLVVLPTYYTLIDDLALGLKRMWQESSPDRRGALPPEEGLETV